MALAFSCPDCRTEFQTRPLPPGAAFACPACGARLVFPGLPVARPEPEPDPDPPADAGHDPRPQRPFVTESAGRRPRVHPVLVTLLAVVPLAAIGAGLIATIVRHKDEPTQRVAAGPERPAGPDAARPPPPHRPAPHTEPDDPDERFASGRPGTVGPTAEPAGAAASAVAILVTVVVGLGVYFAPSLIALARGHTNLAGVFVLNLFLGWTGWFWVLALVWAVWRHAPRVTVVRRE